jgi:D-alanine-D-alanine ligase
VTKLNVLVLVHPDLIPPDQSNQDFDRNSSPWKTEFDVITTLIKMGHNVFTSGLYNNIEALKEDIKQFKPHIVFNLLEEFDGKSHFDQHVVSLLELFKIPYTGCSPKGLTLARDKALSKKIFTYHNMFCPNFFTFHKNRPVNLDSDLKFPMFVKSLTEEASYGISQASLVKSHDKMKERINYLINELETDVIAEEFIEGRELFVGIIGNKNLTTFPVWELVFSNSQTPEKEFYSSSAKFNDNYRKRNGILTQKAILNPSLESKIIEVAKLTYKVLELDGYARIDLRVTSENNIYILEANPNPDIAKDDEFALSADEYGMNYSELLQKILTLGINKT